MVKSPINPKAYIIGASNEIEALCMVAIQLKTLMAEGMPTRKVSTEKTMPA